MNAKVNDPVLFIVPTTGALPLEQEVNAALYQPAATNTGQHNVNLNTHGCMGRHAFLKGALMTVGCCLMLSVVITLCIVGTTAEYCNDNLKQSVKCHRNSFPGGDGVLFGLLGLLLLCAALMVWQCCRKKCTVNTHHDLSLLPLIEPVV